mgnify:CR=1 FL=1
MYYLTPGELTAKIKGDSTFYNTGVKMGARVVLVEGAEMGGDCLNHGCVPSKALLAAAKAAHAMTAGARFGITPVAPA